MWKMRHSAGRGRDGRTGLLAPPLGPRTSCISAFRWAGRGFKLKAQWWGCLRLHRALQGAVGEPFREGLVLLRWISQKTLDKTLIRQILSLVCLFCFVPPHPQGRSISPASTQGGCCKHPPIAGAAARGNVPWRDWGTLVRLLFLEPRKGREHTGR